MDEIWKPISGYENLYEISNLGNIRSHHNYRSKNHLITPRLKQGYYQIGLRKNSKRKWFLVHRLVAKTFISNPNNLPCVNHKDENKLNNSVENLEWCTYHYNNTYGDRINKCVEKTSIPVLKYTLDGKFICRYKSASEAARQNNCDVSSLAKCCRQINKTTKGFVYRYEREVV